MATSKARAERRQEKRDNYASGGYGLGNRVSIPATGQHPQVNPFMLPKDTGLNVISKTFPNNYYVEWNLSTWRAACDQAVKQGYPISYAALVSWCFESSAFVQSLFEQIGVGIESVPVFLEDEKGNVLEEWNAEICNKPWFIQLRKEIIFAKFWGFTGLNFDPIGGKVYKYPMQDIDPINRFIRESTYNVYNGIRFDDNANLLFIQPSTNYEKFLGWMQPITRSYIQMNLNKNNWVAAGKRLAFPLMMAGYPQNGVGKDSTGIEVNPYKVQAEDIIRNADPTNGVVFPYTISPNGEIQKSVMIEFGNSNARPTAHQIFSDFNTDEKNEIREMVLGGNTSAPSKFGTKGTTEVHMDKLDDVKKANLEYMVSELNGEFLTKIALFYRNFPKGAKFGINKSKEWSLEDLQIISPILQANGKKLTTSFFEKIGLLKDFIEDRELPEETQIKEKKEPDAEIAKEEKKSLFGLKKKVTL